MIIINKSGYLKYKNLKFRCALGKAGIGKKKIEGDSITPRGKFNIVKIYYRSDRVKKISSKYRLIKISKNMGWCDDPNSKSYNQLINLPTKYTHEKLYRKDNVYDLLIVLNYNMSLFQDLFKSNKYVTILNLIAVSISFKFPITFILLSVIRS